MGFWGVGKVSRARGNPSGKSLGMGEEGARKGDMWLRENKMRARKGSQGATKTAEQESGQFHSLRLLAQSITTYKVSI